MVLNAAQIHLTLNHIPVVLTGTSLLFFAWAAFQRSDPAWRSALALVALAAVAAVPTYFSGEPTADLLERLPGVSPGSSSGISKELIHEHEEAAEAAFAALLGAGALAMAGLLLMSRKHARTKHALLACVVASVISAGLLARAAHLGGFIRHEEIRPPAR